MARASFFSTIPPVTKNLLIINFIVWLAMMILPGKLGIDLTAYCGLHYIGATDFNPAQLLTYMFMHDTGSFAHILFNMFSLWMFGSVIERSVGSARFLFYYISCGVGAALVQELAWALTWKSTLAAACGTTTEAVEYTMTMVGGQEHISELLNFLVTIGASGAIYGILLAFGFMFPNQPLYLFFIPIPIKAKYMVIGMGVLELLIGMGTARAAGDGIAHFAHMGGMIFGLIILLYWRYKQRQRFNF